MPFYHPVITSYIKENGGNERYKNRDHFIMHQKTNPMTVTMGGQIGAVFTGDIEMFAGPVMQRRE